MLTLASRVLSLSTFGPPFRRLRKVKDHLAGIVADDILLLRENITTTLREYEVQEALEERGMCVFPSCSHFVLTDCSMGSVSQQALRMRGCAHASSGG